MNKPVAFTRVERWNVKDAQKRHSDGRVVVSKIATRVQRGKPGAGQFIGSTNYRGTVLSDQ
jgi:hypothetical protein